MTTVNNLWEYHSHYDTPFYDFIIFISNIGDSIKRDRSFKMTFWNFMGCLVYRIKRCCMCYHKLPVMVKDEYKIKEGKGFHWRCWC